MTSRSGISVVVPARNAGTTIGATLASLSADRAVIGEVLLVDDGSEDDTVERARESALENELPLKVIEARFANAGAARNAGLDAVGGSHVFYLDADDQVIPGGLLHLHDALLANPRASLAVGASIHHARDGEKLKIPGRYGEDRHENARKYLGNELRSITVGSALVAAREATAFRFPERIQLDEDTCYWAALLTRAGVVAIATPVMRYNLDEVRMAQRFVSRPRRVFLDIAIEIGGLAAHGIDKKTLQMRKAFIALRIARQLIRHERYDEAEEMMRVVRAWPGSRYLVKSLQYRFRIAAGTLGLRRGYRKRSEA